MNNWLIIEDKDGERILTRCSKDACDDIEVPYGVTQIARNAFKDCVMITGIIIPNSVQRIGKNAFCGCDSLTMLEMPKASVTIIGGKKFIGRLILTAID